MGKRMDWVGMAWTTLENVPLLDPARICCCFLKILNSWYVKTKRI